MQSPDWVARLLIDSWQLKQNDMTAVLASKAAPVPQKGENMTDRDSSNWPLGMYPRITQSIPETMKALVIHRDAYGPPTEAVCYEDLPVPKLHEEDADRLLVAVLATGPNFNTNFAALGLPVPVFGRGDSAVTHIPGSDALGIVVDAGPGVKSIKVGDAVILDSWTELNLIRGYETHDGFNAQFAVVDEIRAVPIPSELKTHSPERLAAMLLTYGTAYRAIVERLAVVPGDSVLLMGGGKGTSFAGAQIAKSLGAKVLLIGSNPALGRSLIERGIADEFINRVDLPADASGVIPDNASCDQWMAMTEPFRNAVYHANGGKPVDKIFEHTGGRNFPLLASVLADHGCLAFFGATGQGLKGEYKETFFYDGRRFVMDARWVWMRQKQLLFRTGQPDDIFNEIGLLPGRRGLIWGADSYSLAFAEAALERKAYLAVVASHSNEQEGINALHRLGIPSDRIIDRDRFDFSEDMPDPLTEDGEANPSYMSDYMGMARALGRAAWGVFGPRISPDFIIERTDQSTIHYSSFILKDYDESDEMPCGMILAKGNSNLTIAGSHMYRAGQAREVVRLLSQGAIVMEQDDLNVTDLEGLPVIQQKMLDGKMEKPKGVSLVQADQAGRTTEYFENGYLGEILKRAMPDEGEYLDIHLSDGIGIITLCRPDALNALNSGLVSQMAEVIGEVKAGNALLGKPVEALIIRGSGRAFVAGADVTEFHENTADNIQAIAAKNIQTCTDIENLSIPVIALVDGFALGGGNELSMSTHYRIVTENAQLGQPEVKLGIIPGYGGLQRLPRLIGPGLGAEMSINGESIDGRRAVAIGLADKFVSSSRALLEAVRIAQELISGERKLERRNWEAIALSQREELRELLIHPQAADLLISSRAEGEDAADIRAARSYAARFVLDAIRFGYEEGFEGGLENDARLFGEIAASPSGQEWIGRFIAKDPEQSSFLTLLETQ